MKQLKQPIALLMSCTLIVTLSAHAQDYRFDLVSKRYAERGKSLNEARVSNVILDNEYKTTGHEQGFFFDNPLMVEGKPLDYTTFNLHVTGILTVIKGDDKSRKKVRVPFHVYLRRKGDIVLIPGMEKADEQQLRIEMSDVLRHAEPGDDLVIEAVRKEDGPVKRILKLKGGC